MLNNFELAAIKIQIALNRRMYDRKKISYNMYSRVNDILISRLTVSEERDTIIHSERNVL